MAEPENNGLQWNSAFVREIGREVEQGLTGLMDTPGPDASKLKITIRQTEPDGLGNQVVTGKFYDEIPVDLEEAEMFFSKPWEVQEQIKKVIDNARSSHAQELTGRDIKVQFDLVESFGRQADGHVKYQPLPGHEAITVEGLDPMNELMRQVTAPTPGIK